MNRFRAAALVLCVVAAAFLYADAGPFRVDGIGWIALAFAGLAAILSRWYD